MLCASAIQAKRTECSAQTLPHTSDVMTQQLQFTKSDRGLTEERQ